MKLDKHKQNHGHPTLIIASNDSFFEFLEHKDNKDLEKGVKSSRYSF